MQAGSHTVLDCCIGMQNRGQPAGGEGTRVWCARRHDHQNSVPKNVVDRKSFRRQKNLSSTEIFVLGLYVVISENLVDANFCRRQEFCFRNSAKCCRQKYLSQILPVFGPPHTPPLRRWSQGPGNMRTGWLRGLVGRPPWGVFIDFLTRLGQIVPPPSPPPAGDGGGVIGANFAPRVLGGPRRALERSWGGSRGSWGVLGGSLGDPGRVSGGS